MSTKIKKAKSAPAANVVPQPNVAVVPVDLAPVAPDKPLRLDFGCGSNKRENFTGVDRIAFPGVDVVLDLTGPWPWTDNSVEEAHASHFLEHLDALERVHFFNELWRVLVPDGKVTIITPHWCSNRAYGDFTHKFPPVSEMFYFYLIRAWRLGDKEKGIPANAPHTDITNNPSGYDCNFEGTCGYSVHPEIGLKSQEVQQFALQFYREAAQDMCATLVRKP